MRLNAVQVGELTPAEVLAMLDGYQEQMMREWDRTAWLTAHLLTAWSKRGRRVTVSQLLGRPMVGTTAEQTQAQRAANFGAVWAKVEQLRAEGRLLPAENT